jgi:hypothetical protein
MDDNLQVPKEVLQRRLHPRQDGSVPQLLIKWSGLDSSLATWEDAEAIRQQFPEAPAWGHAVTQGEGDVMTPHLSWPKSAQQPRRSKRARRKSSKVHGPQWACIQCAPAVGE